MNPFTRALEGWDGDHWVKGSLQGFTPNGEIGYCALGRLDRVSYGTRSYSWMTDAVTILENVAVELFPNRAVQGLYTSVPAMNNHPDTSWDDMVAWFEKAAARWEEKELVPA